LRKLSRRTFFKLMIGGMVGTAFSGGASYAYAFHVEPYWLDVSRHTVRLPRLDPAFDGYVLVQISDIHADGWMNEQRVAEIVGAINAQSPDAVAITGDFVTSHPITAFMPALAQLQHIATKDGVFAVLGNHDHWTDADVVRNIIRNNGHVELSNTVHTIRRGGASLHIAGVDDVWEKKANLSSVLQRLPPDGAAILLAHEPDFADTSAAMGRFDLQLSGHSHGGQVNLPIFGPPIVPPFAEKYPIGFYQVGTMIQYTNRGLGTITPRVRFNCRPEIAVFTLRSSV
jgi:uncharacterized protein